MEHWSYRLGFGRIVQKRRIIESLVQKIVVSKEEINVTYWAPPSSEELTKHQRNLLAALPFYERDVTFKRPASSIPWKLNIHAVPNPRTLGEALRMKRYILRITQAQAAQILGVDQTTISFWECDKSIPAGLKLAMVKNFLGM